MYEEQKNLLYRYSTISVDNKPSVYNIVVACDNKMLNQLMVLIASVGLNLKRKTNIFLLQSDITENQKNELTDFCSKYNITLHIIEIDISLFNKFRKGRLPYQTYFYFMAHLVLPTQIDRALLLDIDTLILKDISILYDIDFEDTWGAACEEYHRLSIDSYFDMLYGKEPFIYEQFYCTECLVNTGVVMLNLQKMRDQHITLESYSSLQQSIDEKTKLTDQLLFNRFVRNNIKILPKLYFNCWSAHEEELMKYALRTEKANEVYLYNDLNEDLINSIIHYTAYPSTKPWNSLHYIDSDGNMHFLNFANSTHRKNVIKWWDIAKELPEKNYNALIIHSMTDQLPHYKTEWGYFTDYTKILQMLFISYNLLSNLADQLIQYNYKNIGIYGSNKIAEVLIPYFEKKGITIVYVAENFTTHPSFIKTLISRNIESLPTSDLTIVMDVKNTIKVVERIRVQVKNPVISIWDIYNLLEYMADNPDYILDIDFFQYYSNKILLSIYQCLTISQSIKRRAKACNFLIFGCGNDSIFWSAINKNGKTLFLETSLQWKDKIAALHPELDIVTYDVGSNTVEASGAGRLEIPQIPEYIKQTKWDTILIDGPQGFAKDSPGRAIPIIWSSLMAHDDMDIFVDDYERRIEQIYSDIFLPIRGIISSHTSSRNIVAWAPIHEASIWYKIQPVEYRQLLPSLLSATDHDRNNGLGLIMFASTLVAIKPQSLSQIINHFSSTSLYIIEDKKTDTPVTFSCNVSTKFRLEIINIYDISNIHQKYISSDDISESEPLLYFIFRGLS